LARRRQVEFGLAELIPELDRPGAWLLLVDGTAQSYVDINDPTFLEFEYVRRLAAVVDAAAPQGEPLRVLHVGGGGLTLPRYIAATRPGSAQRVAERDVALTRLIREVLPLAKGSGVRISPTDGRTLVERAPPDRYDLVITDAFAGGRVPGHLATLEFAGQVARILRPHGLYGLNVVDGPALRYAKRATATLRAAFADVAVLAEPGVLRSRRLGNVVLVAAREPGGVPVESIAAACRRDAFPARLVHGEEMERFTGGAKPMTDATPIDSPDLSRSFVGRGH
jgi:spermidine synthase